MISWLFKFDDITYSILHSLLHGRSQDQTASQEHTIHFINVFLLVWGGAAVVTVNAQLLRGKVYVTVKIGRGGQWYYACRSLMEPLYAGVGALIRMLYNDMYTYNVQEVTTRLLYNKKNTLLTCSLSLSLSLSLSHTHTHTRMHTHTVPFSKVCAP